MTQTQIQKVARTAKIYNATYGVGDQIAVCRWSYHCEFMGGIVGTIKSINAYGHIQVVIDPANPTHVVIFDRDGNERKTGGFSGRRSLMGVEDFRERMAARVDQDIANQAWSTFDAAVTTVRNAHRSGNGNMHPMTREEKQALLDALNALPTREGE